MGIYDSSRDRREGLKTGDLGREREHSRRALVAGFF